MVKLILRTEHNKIVHIDTYTDIIIYETPRDPILEGADLYAHTTKLNTVVFYLHHWSMWQGSESQFELITRDDAEEFILERAGRCGRDAITKDEWDTLKDFGFEFEEDA